MLLTPLAGVERARRARLVAVHHGPVAARSEAPRVHERPVDVRRARVLVGDQMAHRRTRCAGRSPSASVAATADAGEDERREESDPAHATSCVAVRSTAVRSIRGRRASWTSSTRNASTRCPSISRTSRLDTHPSHLGERLAHRGELRQSRSPPARCRRSRHRQVARHRQAALARGVQRADRDVVVEAEDRGRRVLEREQLLVPPRCRCGVRQSE